MMVETNLNQLHPPATNAAIKLRVVRAWNCKLEGSQRVVAFAFVATDNQGNAIHVQTNEADADIFKDLVVEGGLYLIAAFRLSTPHITHVTVQSDVIMWLTRRSVVCPIPDDVSRYPSHYFELYAEENFEQMANNNSFLAYVVGMVMTISQEVSVEHPSEERMLRKRRLTIGSLFERKIPITLWEESLDMINVPQLLAMNPKPVMIFAGMIVKQVDDYITLTSCSATKLYVNLNIDETAMVQAIYEDIQGSVCLLPPPP